jgi:hypothetical protein
MLPLHYFSFNQQSDVMLTFKDSSEINTQVWNLQKKKKSYACFAYLNKIFQIKTQALDGQAASS